MEFRKSLYEARQTVVRAVNGEAVDGEEDKSPFDPHKYHRAFVAGLVGLPAGIISGIALYSTGKVLEAVGAVFASFFTPFTIQLAIEYNIKPKE